MGGFSAKSRKNFRPRPLLARISTTVDICEAKGGGTHHKIVRGIAAEEGQAVAEYAVILTLVFAAGLVGYQLLGGTVLGLFNSVYTAFTS